MTEQLVFFLLGVYFVGVGLPAIFSEPVSLRNSTMLQLIYGVILLVLAITNVHVLR